MTKPTPDKPQSEGWNKSEDELEKLKQQAEQASETKPKVDGEELPLEFTAKDIIKAYKVGLWDGKRMGRLYALEKTIPHIRKQNERLKKAGHKVGVLKNALRANVQANELTAEAFDD